ncbi:MAG TPA: hypothetical protein VL051_15640 [Burkholderiaceae bacterium]|nr:hypothetical protein [Burkholderiaceae bacterium]
MANTSGLLFTATEADCAACLALLDNLQAVIFATEQQVIDLAQTNGSGAAQSPATQAFSPAPDFQAHVYRLHMDFCRCLEERIGQINQRLASLIELAAKATPSDHEATRAFLRQASRDTDAAYQKFCGACNALNAGADGGPPKHA